MLNCVTLSKSPRPARWSGAWSGGVVVGAIIFALAAAMPNPVYSSDDIQSGNAGDADSGVLVSDSDAADAAPADAQLEDANAELQVALARSRKGLDLNIPQHHRLAQREPLAFLQYCWDHYRRTVQDYRCRFIKQERIRGRIRSEQQMLVNFRRGPDSVHMKFTKNKGPVEQALYIEGAWYDKDGNAQVLVEPAGTLVSLFVPKIKIDVRGKRARKESRRTLDQFGFDKVLGLIMEYSKKAAARGELDLRYVGDGVVDGQPTYILERRLPFTGKPLPYPDRLLVIHIDQENLLPVAAMSYADDAARELLGSYVYNDLEVNVGLTDADFDPDHLGF